MKYKYAAICLAIKNDFCLEEAIVEAQRQGVNRVLIISPRVYWSDESPQAPEDYTELVDISRRTGATLYSARFKTNLSQNNAIYTEALYRNFGVDLLKSDPTLDFILTLDADEFWLPGTLEQVDSLAEACPEGLRINFPAIPVIGAPGLPVAGAKDTVLIATSRNLKFQWGRSPTTQATVKAGTIPVIHFSATRRTLQEVIDKHRKSAHYDDPTYEFEKWIKDVLPNVHVGMRDVHMYVNPDVWPLVRAWTPEELALIPKTLHPFLTQPSHE
jgi:hypothetical protein